MPEPHPPAKIAEKLLSLYFTLIGILIGVLGVVSTQAELEAGSSFYGARVFLVLVATLICIAAAAATLAFLTFNGTVTVPGLNTGLFIFLMGAVFVTMLGWSARVIL